MLSKNHHWISADGSLNSSGKRSRLTNPLPIMLFIFMDVETMAILLLVVQSYCGIYALMTSIPSLMYENYRYNSEQTGYLFLAWSAGTVLFFSFMTGPILDWFYRREARTREMDPKLNIQDMPDFPIEKLRLQLAFPFLAFSGVCMVCGSSRLFLSPQDTNTSGRLCMAGFLNTDARSYLFISLRWSLDIGRKRSTRWASHF